VVTSWAPFGWSLQSLSGFVMMVAIYATIIRATRFTLAPQCHGWRMSRRAKVATGLALAGLVSLVVVSSVGTG